VQRQALTQDFKKCGVVVRYLDVDAVDAEPDQRIS